MLAELARLEEIGVVITDKHVVRFHSPESEQSVLKVDSQKFVTRDIMQSRWRSAPPNSMFDAMAIRIIEQRVGGISNRRYQVHAVSLETLILKLGGLRDRPNLDDTPTSPVTPQLVTPIVLLKPARRKVTAIPSEAPTVLQFLPAAMISKTAERKIIPTEAKKKRQSPTITTNPPKTITVQTMTTNSANRSTVQRTEFHVRLRSKSLRREFKINIERRLLKPSVKAP